MQSLVPSVSVVMSVYNDAGHIRTASASILNQSFRDLELIIVNDGSTDETGEIIDRVATVDPRVRILNQENTGLTRALIRGCALAQGKYIARQDSDDWSHPERIAEQVTLIESDERIGFVSCATQYVGPEDEKLITIKRPIDPEAATYGLMYERQGPPAHGSVLFRRSLYEQVKGYRDEFMFGQDSDLWLRMAERARIAYLADVRYTARREIESISGVRRPIQRRFGELGHLCRQARREDRSEEPYLTEARQLSEQVIASRKSAASRRAAPAVDAAYLLGSQLALNEDARARRYLWQVITARPWHWKAWIRLGQTYFYRQNTGANPEAR